jgi:hypothetical protein
VFYDSASWLSPNRLAAISGTVKPGANGDFKWTFKAPDAPGTYFEYFDLVQESVAWFSDPGQGGPPDDQLEIQIQVVEAPFHARFVAQSYPLSQTGAVMLAVGQKADGWIELKNGGTDNWLPGVTKLAPTPRDKPSPVAASDWLSPTRVSTVSAQVAPGASFKFPLSLEGNAAGDYMLTFSLVEEKVTWFADLPKGGGPSDTFLKVHVIVTDAQQGGSDGGAPAGSDGGVGGGGGGGNSDNGGGASGNGEGSGGSDPTMPGASHGGCDMSASDPIALGALLILLAWLIVRRGYFAKIM